MGILKYLSESRKEYKGLGKYRNLGSSGYPVAEIHGFSRMQSRVTELRETFRACVFSVNNSKFLEGKI